MTPSHVRVAVVGSSMVEINCTGYVCTGANKKNHLGISSGGKFKEYPQQLLQSVKFVNWVWFVVKLIM